MVTQQDLREVCPAQQPGGPMALGSHCCRTRSLPDAQMLPLLKNLQCLFSQVRHCWGHM